MLVLLDHRDSFTYNLAQAFETLGATITVREARRTSLATLLRLKPRHLVLGPGPGRPESATLARAALERLAPEVPTLGVCLGFQLVGHVFGARVERAAEPVHGRTVPVHHDGRGVFQALASPLRATRYNSLAVLDDGLSPELEVSARAADGDVMGLRHRTWPLEGVQFHPESVLSEHGLEILANFLRM